MDEIQHQASASNARPKRTLTPFDRFSQKYLPALIGGAAMVFILMLVIGAILYGFRYRTLVEQVRHDAAVAAKLEQERQSVEFEALSKRAAELAIQYDYEGAITLLQSFTGDKKNFPTLDQLIDSYRDKLEDFEQWTDFSAIPNLSFEILLLDAQRAFKNAKYGSSYKTNFITTEEFKLILEQLYKNSYILIELDDLYEYKKTDSGVSYFVEKELLLPSGKKPLLLTQTQVNYNLYMVDSDGDMIADAGGSGFASKLIVDENGNFANEYVDSEGETHYGAYDLVPILESFIATHPDFSYRGARAVIALTGYNGLFGYRTQAEAVQLLREDGHQQEVEKAKFIANALQEAGYKLACYTYENKDYTKFNATKIEADMSGWNAEVVPILGQLDTFVFAKNGDLASSTAEYSSEGYQYLENAGFKFYLGYCKDGKPWVSVNDQYVRQGRIVVTASNLKNKKSWFNGILDPSAVLIESR